VIKFADLNSILREFRNSPLKTSVHSMMIFGLSIAGIWAKGYFGEAGKQQASKPREVQGNGRLEVVGLSVQDSKSPSPSLDLKLLNSGTATVFLTEVTAEVLGDIQYRGRIDPSAKYDLLVRKEWHDDRSFACHRGE